LNKTIPKFNLVVQLPKAAKTLFLIKLLLLLSPMANRQAPNRIKQLNGKSINSLCLTQRLNSKLKANKQCPPKLITVWVRLLPSYCNMSLLSVAYKILPVLNGIWQPMETLSLLAQEAQDSKLWLGTHLMIRRSPSCRKI